MPRFMIETECTANVSYVVDADTQEDAIKAVRAGLYLTRDVWHVEVQEVTDVEVVDE